MAFFLLDPDHRLAEEIVRTCLGEMKLTEPDQHDAVVRLVARGLTELADYESVRQRIPRDVQKAREVLRVLERAALRAAKLLPSEEDWCKNTAESARLRRILWTKSFRRAARPLDETERELHAFVSREEARNLMCEVRRAVSLTASTTHPDDALRLYLESDPDAVLTPRRRN